MSSLTCTLLSDGGLQRGDRERGSECLDFVTGFSERCILQPARVHHRHTPPPPYSKYGCFPKPAADIEQNPETGYQLHVTPGRAWPLERGFIMEINRLLLGTRVLCLSGQSYLSTKGGREKEGLPNGSHSLPLAGKEERLNWKTQLAKWPQNKEDIRVILDLVLILFTISSNTPQQLQTFLSPSRPKPFPPLRATCTPAIAIPPYSGLHPSVEH